MTTVTIGKLTDGQPLSIDLARLVETRMLIEANSGGGKSYLIRKLLEVTYGKIQQIVLDMEGEFYTLREKFDYILGGKEGDIPADPRSAELLARKILELNASIIIDLSELKQDQRVRFVKMFLEGLIEAPKDLRHPVLVVLDEAHHFCPEKGKGEAESSEAVIDLATRGRKRGLCAVYATQRLGKFNKDAAAEGLNKLIGRTGLDLDQKRAGEELGFRTQDQTRALRDLEPGEFYAYGPAISKAVVKGMIGEVITTHPHSGERIIATIPTPTDKVLKILSKLTDLPKEAEKEAKTKEELLAKIRQLRQEVRSKPRPEFDQASMKRIADANYSKGWKAAEHQYRDVTQKQVSMIQGLISKVKRITEIIGTKEIPKIEMPTMPRLEHAGEGAYMPDALNKVWERQLVKPEPQTIEYPAEGPAIKYGRCEKMILKFLSTQPGRPFNKSQIGAMTGYSATSGGFGNSLSILRKQNLIIQHGELISINSDELDRAEQISADIALTTLDDWLNTLGKAEREIYKVLKDNPEETFTKESLAEKTNYSATSGGFGNAISHLCTLGLAQRTDGGIRFNPDIQEFL
jgi:hypothetical protein